MKKIILFFISSIIISSFSFGQNYSPLLKGSKKTFSMGHATYTKKILKKTVKKDGKEYFQSLTKYSWGNEVSILLRLDSLENEIYLDPKSNTESINFPANPKVGLSWLSTDGSWKYEILTIGTKFKTPIETYSNCLVIKAQQITGRDKEKLDLYYNYYVKDIGYVGSENSKGLMSWLTKYKKEK
jgi:hypothetical protein